MFNYINHTEMSRYNIPGYSEWYNQYDSDHFFWAEQALVFSTNQCLVDRSAAYDFKNCLKAPFICKVNNTLIMSKEKRSYEDAVKECQHLHGHLCK